MFKPLIRKLNKVRKVRPFLLYIFALILFSGISFAGYTAKNYYDGVVQQKQKEKTGLETKLKSTLSKLTALENQDQYKINTALKAEVDSINKTFIASSKTFEKINDLKSLKADTSGMEKDYANILNLLAEKKYSSAEADLQALNKEINEMMAKLKPTVAPAIAGSSSNAPVNNTPPGSGFQVQNVSVDGRTFTVSIVAADLNSTRVIVDTASDGTCTSNCPVLSLADYVSRNGAFAGINGSYFCPASYPSCAGKENSFDTLLMNKNKVYFNSDNNVYSQVPVVAFSGNSARFMGQSLEWGRDTGVDAVIANQPLLVLNGSVVFGGDGEAKRASVGPRGFIGNTDSKVYIGVVYSATAADAAKVLQTMGIRNALNLDSGGSTALWSGGYKAGPGRNIPNAILFVSK